jgi:FHA domain-containing protein
VALPLLKILFERLREAHALILQLQKADPGPAGDVEEPVAIGPVPPREQLSITLEGVTPQAVAALPLNPFPITHFPFRIGRQSADPLVYNDLMLPDAGSRQISRHHLTFILHEGRVGVVDRGSALGSWVGVLQIGGPSGRSGPVFFTGAEALVVLGSRESPFRFRVSLPVKAS